jgi:hypothetical protein
LGIPAQASGKNLTQRRKGNLLWNSPKTLGDPEMERLKLKNAIC